MLHDDLQTHVYHVCQMQTDCDLQSGPLNMHHMIAIVVLTIGINGQPG